MSAAERHHVRLQVPAATGFLYLVRLSAAGVGSEAGLDVAAIDDVKIAVDELCSAVIRAGTGGPIELTFETGGEGLTIAGHRPGVEHARLDELVQTILEATVDDYSFETGPGGVDFRISKHARGV